MKLTIKNIGILAGIDESGRDRIAGADMARLEVVENAYLTAEEGLIASYGRMEELPSLRAALPSHPTDGWKSCPKGGPTKR